MEGNGSFAMQPVQSLGLFATETTEDVLVIELDLVRKTPRRLFVSIQASDRGLLLQVLATKLSSCVDGF